jgi:hypothetical protein
MVTEMSTIDIQPPKVTVACVTENHPAWFSRVVNLVWSVRTFGGRLADTRIVVCVVDDCEPRFARELERFDADVRIVPSVDPVIRYANKLRMFEQQDIDDVLLALDCDTVVVGDPSDFIPNGAIGLKPVDRNYLSQEQWRRLLGAMDLDLPAATFRTTSDGEPIHGYFNSGVVAVPSRFARELADSWAYYVSALPKVLDQTPDLGLWRRYSDQFALACALIRTGLPVEALPVTMNFPTHIRADEAQRAGLGSVQIIHYHREIDDQGFLFRGRDPIVNRQIGRFNRARADRFGLPDPGLGRLPPSVRARRLVTDLRFLHTPTVERLKQRARPALRSANSLRGWLNRSQAER